MGSLFTHLGATALFISIALPSITSAACNNFTPASGVLSGAPNDQTFTSTSQRAYRVSAVVYCSGSALGTDISDTNRCNSSQCALSVPPNFLVDVYTQLNISVTDQEREDILSLVKRNTSELNDNALADFNTSATVSVSGSTCIPANITQFWSLTPVLICADGTLSSCSGSDSPTDGTAIRACGIDYFAINSNGIGIPSHGPNLVTTDSTSALPAPANASNIIRGDPPSAASQMSKVSWTWTIGIISCAFLAVFL